MRGGQAEEAAGRGWEVRDLGRRQSVHPWPHVAVKGQPVKIKQNQRLSSSVLKSHTALGGAGGRGQGGSVRDVFVTSESSYVSLAGPQVVRSVVAAISHRWPVASATEELVF